MQSRKPHPNQHHLPTIAHHLVSYNNIIIPTVKSHTNLQQDPEHVSLLLDQHGFLALTLALLELLV